MVHAAATPEVGRSRIPLLRVLLRLWWLVLGAVGRGRLLHGSRVVGERPRAVGVLVVRGELLVVGRQRPAEVALQVL